MSNINKEYILGTNQTELERLEFQHGVWKNITDSFLEKLNIQKGWKCLDVGAGPGYVSMDLRSIVGDAGEVTALEPSDFYLSYFKERCERNNFQNVKFINGNLEDVDLQIEHYDLIYLRWVIDFVKEPENFLLKLLSALKKGGVIAIQDYNYEGIGLYPKGGAFDNIADHIRAYWRAGGGDPYFVSKIPPVFKKNNIKLEEYSPVGLAGDSQCPVFEWADRFLSGHFQLMKDLNIISENEKSALIDDWEAHKKNPDTVFYSPVVVNVSGRKL